MGYTAKDFWSKFGSERFTKSDLWRAFGHQAFPGFPTPEWLEEIGIGRYSWIESAPGPRGGEGWRLSSDVVESMQSEDAKRKRKDERVAALLGVVNPSVGECRPSEGKLRWTYWPPVELPGNHPNGRKRYGPVFEMKWPATAKAAVVQRDLDRAAIYISELANRAREKRQAEIDKLDELIAKATTNGCKRAP